MVAAGRDTSESESPTQRRDGNTIPDVHPPAGHPDTTADDRAHRHSAATTADPHEDAATDDPRGRAKPDLKNKINEKTNKLPPG